MKHDTTVISVRAHVDNLIVPVVQALLAFPEISTLYSCQGSQPKTMVLPWSWEKDAAYVVVLVGKGTAIENAVFFDYLLSQILTCSATTRIALTSSMGATQLEFRMRQDEIDSVVQWLKSIRRDWLGLVNEHDKRWAKIQAQ
jgi:hypothetical protein